MEGNNADQDGADDMTAINWTKGAFGKTATVNGKRAEMSWGDGVLSWSVGRDYEDFYRSGRMIAKQTATDLDAYCVALEAKAEALIIEAAK